MRVPHRPSHSLALSRILTPAGGRLAAHGRRMHAWLKAAKDKASLRIGASAVVAREREHLDARQWERRHIADDARDDAERFLGERSGLNQKDGREDDLDQEGHRW